MRIVRLMHRYLVRHTFPGLIVPHCDRITDAVAGVYLGPLCRQVTASFGRHCAQAWAPIVRSIQEARQGQLLEPEREKAYHDAWQRLPSFQNYFLEVLAARGIDANAIREGGS